MASLLLDLPPELKWLIFDELLEPLSHGRHSAREPYALSCEWPSHPDLSNFFALAATSSKLRTEASSYFEHRFLPKTTFYFDNMPSLYSFYQAVATFKPDYLKSARFSLRHRCHLLCTGSWGAANKSVRRFMMHNNPKFDWMQLLSNFLDGQRTENEGRYDWDGADGVHLEVERKGRATIDTIQLPENNGLKFTHREIRGLKASEYWELTGSLGSLEWSGYDREVEEKLYAKAISKTLNSSQADTKYVNAVETLLSLLLKSDAWDGVSRTIV